MRTGRRRWRSTRSRRPGEQRLAGAGRAVGSRIPFGTRAPSLRNRFGSRRNSTTSRSSSFASSAPATSVQRVEPRRRRLDLLRLGARHVAQGQPDQHDGDQAHEDDRQPQDGPVLDVLPAEAVVGRGGRVGRAREAEAVASVVAGERAARRSELPAGGQRSTRRAQDLAQLVLGLVAGQIAGLERGDAVLVRLEREAAEPLLALDDEGGGALGRAALGQRGRSSQQEHRQTAQEKDGPHLPISVGRSPPAHERQSTGSRRGRAWAEGAGPPWPPGDPRAAPRPR